MTTPHLIAAGYLHFMCFALYSGCVLLAGNDASMQPWAQDDLDDLRKGVKSVANRFYTAAHELQRKVQYLPDLCSARSDDQIKTSASSDTPSVVMGRAGKSTLRN
jgi:hypothetical protein